MRLSVAIMAHPARRDGACGYGKPGGEIPIVYDTNPSRAQTRSSGGPPAAGRGKHMTRPPTGAWCSKTTRSCARDMLAGLERALISSGRLV